MPNVMRYGRPARSAEPTAEPRNPPAVAQTTIEARATLSFTPGKCTILSRNARKKIMKPENARRMALARMASMTIGPTRRSVRSPSRDPFRFRPEPV